MSNVLAQYQKWLKYAVDDPDITAELQSIAKDEQAVFDRFYRDLKFGTGGLRGIIGAGSNRMNIYTVAKASQGIADYVNKSEGKSQKSIAISFDSRIKSHLFAQIAAEVFAANGIYVYIYKQLMPTPCLSYAVRNLHCNAGVMITASHNPAEYNGYKVYGADGCQITDTAAEKIYNQIEKTDIFSDIKRIDFADGINSGHISYIPESIYTSFIDDVKRSSVLFGDKVDKAISIIYTPLNGTGAKPVIRALREQGFNNITVVKEQENPDGDFPTCPYPNPETEEAMKLGIEYAEMYNADLLIATDPDCDRVGIAVRYNGKMTLLTGNEVGLLLLDFICSQRKKHNKMPKDPVFVKTIVTVDLAEKVAASYGVKTINVLTGFKYIGEQIGLLEKANRQNSYILGFEESYGYLSGTYVRDKDAVNGASLICDMFCYYRTRGVSLIKRLDDIYKQYGYCKNTLHSYKFDGASGSEKMQRLMRALRSGVESIAETTVVKCADFFIGIDGLPKSDVIKFYLADGSSVVVRPSGTEPKLKLYICVNAESEQKAQATEQNIVNHIEKHFIDIA